MNSTAVPNRSYPYLPDVAPHNIDQGHLQQSLHTTPPSSQYPAQRAPRAPQHARYPSATISGIMKSHAPPAPSVADDTDAWGGVRAVPASSRPPSKLKTMFHLWKSSEVLKSSKSSVPPSLPPKEPRPQLSKPLNPPVAKHRLRFVDAVELIPRPEVDSDPYEDEDEDEEEEVLPPSPRRGSMIWVNAQDPLADLAPLSISDHTEINLSSSASSSSQLSLSSYYQSHSIEHHLASPSSGATSSTLSNPASPSSIYSSYVTSDDGHTSESQHPNPYAGLNEPRHRQGQSGGMYSSSGSNLAPVSQDGIQYARMPPSHAAGDIAYASSPSSARSHHDRLHAIFPSPSQTPVSARDLMFIR